MWSIREWWRSRDMKSDLEEARQERELSQRRLDEAKIQVIVPLSALREENHITELVRKAFQRRPNEVDK
jgi:hypothetical protein